MSLNRTPFIPLRLFLCALLTIVLVIGCADSDDPAEPCVDCPFVVIEGLVAGGFGPLDAEVMAVRTDLPQQEAIWVTAYADSAGHYLLPVPPGDYELQVQMRGRFTDGPTFFWGREGLSSARESADTISIAIGAAPTTMDFLFGALTLHLDFPEELNGEQVRSLLFEAIGSGSIDAYTQVEDRVAEFIFPAVPPGSHQIRVDPSRAEIWLPGSVDRAHAAIVSVQPLAVASFEGVLPSPGHLRGSVRGSWQQMEDVEWPRVTPYGPDSVDSPWRDEPVDRDGRFSFEFFGPVTVRLKVEIQHLDRWFGGTSFAEATTFEVGPSLEVDGVDYVESGLLVELDVLGETRVEHAIYKLADVDRQLVVAGGRYVGVKQLLPIPNLVPGIYYLRIEADGLGRESWLSQWYDQSRWLATATPIEVASTGAVVPVTAHLVEGGRIPARLLRADGLPVVGKIRVVLTPWNDRPYQWSSGIEADDSGNFVIRGLPDGDWKVGQGEMFTAPTWYPGTVDWDSAAVISIIDHSEADPIEWSMAP